MRATLLAPERVRALVLIDTQVNGPMLEFLRSL